MKKIISVLTLTICVICMNGCYYDNEADLYPNKGCDMSVTTYSGSISKIIATNCASSNTCHATGGQTPTFTDYPSIYSNRDQITLHAIVIKDMPKGSALTPCDYNKLKQWLDSGAPNN